MAWGSGLPEPYLFLAQDKDAVWFDGVPGCQVLARTSQFSVLVCRPQSIPGSPGDTDMVPVAVFQAQRQLGHLDTGPKPHVRGPRLEKWDDEAASLIAFPPSTDGIRDLTCIPTFVFPVPTLPSPQDPTKQLSTDHRITFLGFRASRSHMVGAVSTNPFPLHT